MNLIFLISSPYTLFCLSTKTLHTLICLCRISSFYSFQLYLATSDRFSKNLTQEASAKGKLSSSTKPRSGPSPLGVRETGYLVFSPIRMAIIIIIMAINFKLLYLFNKMVMNSLRKRLCLMDNCNSRFYTTISNNI